MTDDAPLPDDVRRERERMIATLQTFFRDHGTTPRPPLTPWQERIAASIHFPRTWYHVDATKEPKP